jgi:hypothetical protein
MARRQDDRHQRPVSIALRAEQRQPVATRAVALIALLYIASVWLVSL